MDKVGAILVVRGLLLKRRRNTARRLKLKKRQRSRRQREFVQYQAMERFMFVLLMAGAFCSLSPDRMLWAKVAIGGSTS